MNPSWEQLQAAVDSEISWIRYATTVVEMYSNALEENARLRKALEFYANQKHTDEYNYVDLDGGQTAREALNNGEALHGTAR